ncbi:MAG: TM0106 family RecB-like putative nuclease [Candidatus Omnitrophota bacterium]|nr:TM0106 family RecB-like putative nuclease [Candidatus Omnitrophota bacterium]
MIPQSQYKISASSFYDLSRCRRRVYMDLHGNPEEKSEHSEFLQLLWKRGFQIEKKVLDQIVKEKPVCAVEGIASLETFEQTLALMKQGVPLIYQGVLIFQDKIGRPDLLQRTEGKSGLGGYYYSPCDIKSGRATRSKDSEDLKSHYANQMLFYAELLEAIQGRKPEQGSIIQVDGEIMIFDMDDYFSDYEEVKASVHAIVYDKDEPEPLIGGVCKECVWSKPCLKWAEDKRDPSLLFYMGKQKYKLREKGIHTIEDLAKIDVQAFLRPPLKIHRVAEDTLLQWKRRAQVWVDGRPIVHTSPNLRSARREVFYDIEDDPSSNHVYLHGFIERIDGKTGEFKSFLAIEPLEEKRAAKETWAYIETLSEKDIIYHYGSYENTKLSHLQKKYSLPEETFQKFRRLHVDLCEVVKQSSDWPLTSYGIKSIAKFLGFRWTSEDASGANSIAWYTDYQKDPVGNKDLLEKILTYNREDCEAMIVVHDWLSMNSK